MLKVALIAVGALVALLGLLWLLQGTGVVQIGPILCVADCEPVTGPSAAWAIAGAIALIVGTGIAYLGIRRSGQNSIERGRR